MLDTRDSYWLAGILEGEGCFTWRNRRKKRAFGVQLSMTDLDVIERAATITSYSNKIYCDKRANRKTLFSIKWCGDSARNIASYVQGLMGKRRGKKIEEIMNTPYLPISFPQKVDSEEVRFWLAGYLEGEACFRYNKRYRNGGLYARPSFRVQSIDEDIVHRVAKLLGLTVGVSHTPYMKSKNQKQIFGTGSQGKEKVEDIFLLVRDLMGERRKAKIDEVLSLPYGRIG